MPSIIPPGRQKRSSDRSPPADPGVLGPVVLDGRAVVVELGYGHVGDPIARVDVVFRSLAGRLGAVGVAEEDVLAGVLVFDALGRLFPELQDSGRSLRPPHLARSTIRRVGPLQQAGDRLP